MPRANRLLVLGATGYLGARVVAATQAAGLDVIGAGRDDAALAASGVETRVCDALRPAATLAMLAEVAPTHIVVCTALSRMGDCDAYPGLARALNVDLPQRVASHAEASGARLVHVSTDLVFGDRPPPPAGFSEDDAVGPVSLYGETKAEGERAVLATARSALVVRLPLLFGDSGGLGRGASDALLAALERGERPLLFTDEFRTPLPVRTAAAALVELALVDLRGLLHVAGPRRVSRHELAHLVLRSRGIVEPETRITASTRGALGLEATRPADVSLDATRARHVLATPLPDPADALAG